MDKLIKFLKQCYDAVLKYTPIIWKMLTNKITLTVIALFFVVSYLNKCSDIKDMKKDEIMNKQNVEALKNELQYVKLKNGDLQTSTSGFISTIKDLKNLNAGLYNDVKLQKGKVLSLSTTVIRLRQDSTTLADKLSESEFNGHMINDSTFAADWYLKYVYDSVNSDEFSGQTTIRISGVHPLNALHLNTLMLSRETRIKLTFGEKIVDDKLQVFITSSYPGMSIESLEGWSIDPNSNPLVKKLMKKKHWFTGFNAGISITPGFNLLSGSYGLVIGPSFSYSIYNW